MGPIPYNGRLTWEKTLLNFTFVAHSQTFSSRTFHLTDIFMKTMVIYGGCKCFLDNAVCMGNL